MTYNLPIDAFTALEDAFGDRTKAEKVARVLENAFKDFQKESDSMTELKTKELSTKADLANTKAELLKWMFIFWAGQLVAIAGLIKLIG